MIWKWWNCVWMASRMPFGSFASSMTRYYQLLNELIDSPEALKFDPVLVKRLRAQRARRHRIRSPHPGTK